MSYLLKCINGVLFWELAELFEFKDIQKGLRKYERILYPDYLSCRLGNISSKKIAWMLIDLSIIVIGFIGLRNIMDNVNKRIFFMK
jgi:hypothetical protein